MVARYHPGVMNAPPRQDKFRAYRDRRKAAGLKEARFWMPDLTSPRVRLAIAEENARLQGHASEREAAEFIDGSIIDAMRGSD